MRKTDLMVGALLVACVSGFAHAQSGPPGMPPLTRPVSSPQEVQPETTRSGAALTLGAPSTEGNTSSPATPSVERRMVDTSSTPRVPSALAAAARNEPIAENPDPVAAARTLASEVATQKQSVYRPADTGRQAGGVVEIRPGRNEVLQVARNHLNRFVTPFANPVVKTTATATTTSAEGSIVYMATGGTDPVSLFIIDGDSPEHAITLTLIPRDVPAVSTQLRLDGYIASAAPSRKEAERFEAADDFVATIRETFKLLAQGEIPPGYGLRNIRGYTPEVPQCVMPGIRSVPAQELTGSNVVVLVSKVTNTTSTPQVIDEASCASDRVVAVAAWPHVDLLPGQSSELFIALRRDQPQRANARPSVL